MFYHDWLKEPPRPAKRFGQLKVPLETRFWRLVDKNGPIPENRPELGHCWVWVGHVNKKTGYGQVFLKRIGPGRKRHASAHRVVFLLTAGQLPPRELEPDHLCKNRRCIRPEHLELVTHEENIRRRTPTHCKRGHLFEGNMVKNGAAGRVCRTCKYLAEARSKARRFGTPMPEEV